jgi:predicted O-methyltransferase YrrM
MINKFDLIYKLKPFSDIFLFLGNSLKPKIAAISEEPYSTHIPIIIGISSLINIKYVLEIGSGIFSTGTFLNNRIFPNLSTLESYEDDVKWAETIKSKFGNDSRLHLNVVESPMFISTNNIKTNSFELILIDDSQKESDRAKTISKICKKGLNNTIILIHDFEIGTYRKAAKSLKQYFTFSSFTPCTGVLWNNGIKQKQLVNLSKLIELNKSRIKTTDIDGWLEVFKKN